MKHLNDYINEDLLWDQYYADNIELYEGRIWNNIKNWFKKLFIAKKKDKSYSGGYGRYYRGMSGLDDSTSKSKVSIAPNKSTSNYDKINDKGVISSGKLESCINNTTEVREAFFAKLKEANVTQKKGFYNIRKRLIDDNEIKASGEQYFYGYSILNISKDQMPFVAMFVLEEQKKYYELIAFELEHTIDDKQLVELGANVLNTISKYCSKHNSYIVYHFDKKYLDERADFMKKILTAAKFQQHESNSSDYGIYYKMDDN